MKSALFALFLTLPLGAQTLKPDTAFETSITYTTAMSGPLPATWEDKITRDGHYVATLDDPNNEFRCDVVSYVDTNPNNAFESGINSFTVVCTKKREPKKELGGPDVQ